MSDYVRKCIGKPGNVRQLMICQDVAVNEDQAGFEARLSRMAGFTRDVEFIGIEADLTCDGIISCTAFTDAGSGFTAAELDYVLSGCAVTLTCHDAPVFFSRRRYVYALTMSGKEKASGFDRAAFKDAADILRREKALLRLTYGRKCFAAVSLPCSISSGLRKALSRAFPGTRVISAGSMTPEHSGVPADYLSAAMYGTLVLSAMYSRENGEDPEFDLDIDDEDLFDPMDAGYDLTDDTPIEELDLSVRSYNCLKRAAINTVSQIRAMTDEQLRSVRNLGLRSFNEIREKVPYDEAFAKLQDGQTETFKSSAQMLDELIGLDDIKTQVRKITAFAKMKKALKDNGGDNLSMALNMEFAGNPGTAKTTVARILAGILNDEGILPSGKIVEVGRSDLVGEYVGKTAVKVKDVFERAKGHLLFIDEAYSLAIENNGSFGDEAITAIVQEMENNRDNTIVIFAGYPDEMEKFLDRNPGLRSRIPFKVEFDDYTAEQMLDISCYEAGKRGFTLSEEARVKVLSCCEKVCSLEVSGNGRFCRNLIENAILSYADRVYGGNASGPEQVSGLRLEAPDIIMPKNVKSKRKGTPIGFRC